MDKGWTEWRRFIERAVVFLGALGVVVLLVLIGFNALAGAPNLEDIQDQLDRIETLVEQLE